MKVHIEARNSVYYPDILVCCDQNDRDELCVRQPCFIVEVLSPSTARVDRYEKRASYERLPSLQEFALVEQNRMRVELYQREGEGWQGYLLLDPDDTVRSSCLGLKMTLAQIYQDVEFPPLGVAEEEAEYA
jgi:Uma2 family endonuclease